MTTQHTALRLADALDAGWCPAESPQQMTDAAAELRRLHAEVSRLQAWHQTAWQRGHAVGLNGLNEALRQMEDHKKSDAWGNTQLTEALLRAEEQRDELREALRAMLEVWEEDPAYGATHADKARAAISKAEGQA